MSFYSAEAEPSRYEATSIEDVISGALEMLDTVTLSPQEAQLILDYRLEFLGTLLEDGVIEPDEMVSDELFALSEIAASDTIQSFGQVYRTHHVSSVDEPFVGGLRETSLATDLVDGAIWPAIEAWRTNTVPSKDQQELI